MRIINFLLEDNNSEKIDTFRALRLYARGKITSDELENLVPTIDRVVKRNTQFKGDDKVVIEFDNDDELFELIGLDENDTYLVSNSHYEWYDRYTIEESMLDGYTHFRYLDDDNKEKIDRISKILVGHSFQEIIDNHGYMSDFMLKLSTTFEDQFDQIVYIFTDAINIQMSESAERTITRDIENSLKKFGFNLYRYYDKLSIHVNDLIGLFATSTKMRGSIKDLIQQVFSGGAGIGGWSDNYGDFEDLRDVNWNSVDREMNWQLEKILDKLEDDENQYKDFLRFFDKISSSFKTGVWYELPKKPDLLFSVKGYNPENLKVKVQFKTKTAKKGSSKLYDHDFSEQDFNNFLYQPELFPIWDS